MLVIECSYAPGVLLMDSCSISMGIALDIHVVRGQLATSETGQMS